MKTGKGVMSGPFRPAITGLFLLFAILLLTLLLSTPSAGKEGAVGVVVLDVEEFIEERPGRGFADCRNHLTHRLRQVLREAGYRVVSFRSTAYDKKTDEVETFKNCYKTIKIFDKTTKILDKKKREAAAARKLAALKPDFAVRGVMRVLYGGSRLRRTAEGKRRETACKGSVHLVVTDASGVGREICFDDRLVDVNKDIWSRPPWRKLLQTIRERMGTRAAADLVKIPPIWERVSTRDGRSWRI
jgi:hypothetical protein